MSILYWALFVFSPLGLYLVLRNYLWLLEVCVKQKFLWAKLFQLSDPNSLTVISRLQLQWH